MLNPNRGKLNKTTNRKELPYKIYCCSCNKHICDSEWEMENKKCLVCSGVYAKILKAAGVKKPVNHV